jgi:hypothetical protein
MANFSSFFPAPASGGGGFTKMNKYSTSRALNDSTHKLNALSNNSGSLVTDGSAGTVFDLIYDQPAQSISAAPSTYTIKNLRFNSSTALNVGAVIPANFYAGGKVRFSAGGINNNQMQVPSVISSHPEFTYADSNSSLVFSYSTNPQGAFSAGAINNLGTGDAIPLFTSTSFTVNPATDLGLSDGDSIGYFMIGGGGMTNASNGSARGGKIIQGTAIISNASTDLILTIGTGAPYIGSDGGSGYDNEATGADRQSTISGGLSLTTADGSNSAGYGAWGHSPYVPAGTGVNGYGVGASNNSFRNSYSGYGYQWGGGNTSAVHGYGHGGTGVSNGFLGSDGAILLYF